MKNTIITILAFFGLIIVVTILYKSYIKHEDTKQETSQLITDAKNDFRAILKPISKDSNGNQHYITQSNKNVYKQSEIDNNPEILDKTIVDSLAKLLKIKAIEIVKLQQINVSVNGKLLKAKKEVDSLGNVVSSYKDPFISITYDNGFFNYNETFNLNQVEHPSKKFLWIKYRNVIDFSTDNPRAVINNVKTYTVVPNPPVWSLQVGGGLSYDFSSKIITPSGQVSIGYKNFYFNGGVIYNYWDVNKVGLKPFVSINYLFIKLK